MASNPQAVDDGVNYLKKLSEKERKSTISKMKMLWMEKGDVQFSKTFNTVDGIGSAHLRDHVYFFGGDPEKGKAAYFHKMKIKDYKFENFEIDYGPILRCNHLMVGMD